MKGNAIHAYVVLRVGFTPSEDLEDELRQHISMHLSPIAKPDHIEFVDGLPKTR